MEYKIVITGQGTLAEICKALRVVASGVKYKMSDHKVSTFVDEWEDPTLMTTLTKLEEEKDE